MFGFLFQRKLFRDSSMVEHSAVNRRVAGSSPARGAKKIRQKPDFLFINYSSAIESLNYNAIA
jgi:hypothetical protein